MSAQSVPRALTRSIGRGSSSRKVPGWSCWRPGSRRAGPGGPPLAVFAAAPREMVAPSAEGAVLAMRRALEHAGVRPEEVDYVNTHATSTPLGDVSEVRALQRVLDGRHVSYSSTKGYTGHPVSASGTIEAIFTAAMLREGWIAPSVNAEPLDPELVDYPPVLVPTSRPMRVALSNSFLFCLTNATLVLARP